ncbi:MAG: hypothetical protein DMF78_14095 [Acidobacteria bacterium]|nr:MAG: hypothetical protein DMF78_14095 [Acidobacteriota bacterium]
MLSSPALDAQVDRLSRALRHLRDGARDLSGYLHRYVSAGQVATSNAGRAPAEPLVLLEVEALGVRLSGRKILDGVSFAISEGERVGLIGPNGAGKTSLLEAVAGFAPLDAGKLRWRGAPLGAHDRKERIFYLPDGIRPCPDHRASSSPEPRSRDISTTSSISSTR